MKIFDTIINEHVQYHNTVVYCKRLTIDSNGLLLADIYTITDWQTDNSSYHKQVYTDGSEYYLYDIQLLSLPHGPWRNSVIELIKRIMEKYD